jgi:hypothetical protein
MASALFDLQVKQLKPAKHLSVRVPVDQRQKLEMIARERKWQLSDMVKNMISNFLEEYEKLPKAKQTKFDFVR